MNARKDPICVYPTLRVKTHQRETIPAIVLRSMKEMEDMGEQVADKNIPTPSWFKLPLVRARFYFHIYMYILTKKTEQKDCMMYNIEIKCRNWSWIHSFSNCYFMVILGLQEVEVHPTERRVFQEKWRHHASTTPFSVAITDWYS